MAWLSARTAGTSTTSTATWRPTRARHRRPRRRVPRPPSPACPPTTCAAPAPAGDDFLRRNFTQLVTGLQPATTYHFRAVAQSATGTVYSDDFAVKTPAKSSVPYPSPSTATGDASSITDTAATVAGTVNPQGRGVTTHFVYSTKDATVYGAQWLSTPSQDAGSGTADEAESARLTGLLPGTTYYYRVAVVRYDEVVYSGTRTFTTSGSTAPPPLVSTGSASSVTQ